MGGGEASRLQAEMLQLDLIDATGDTPAEEGTAPDPIKEPQPVTMDTYRPKRPTTLNLFPQVPRTQVSPSASFRPPPPDSGKASLQAFLDTPPSRRLAS